MGVVPEWLDELTLRPAPPYLEMGTRQLADDAWLVVDERRDEQLALKRQVLDEHPDVVSARLAGTEPAARETLTLVRRWLTRHHPGFEQVAAPGDADRPALEQAALLVQEDLTLMRRDADAWRLADLVVCFPTFWHPASKLGLPVTELHGPVPHYATELADRVVRFLDRLPPDRPAIRRNWGVSATADLYAPVEPTIEVVPAGEAPPPLWLRSERETLRRVTSDVVLFTIRVQQAPVAVLAERPDRAAEMAAVVRSWDESSARYRSTGSVGPALLAWLDVVASA